MNSYLITLHFQRHGGGWRSSEHEIQGLSKEDAARYAIAQNPPYSGEWLAVVWSDPVYCPFAVPVKLQGAKLAEMLGGGA